MKEFQPKPKQLFSNVMFALQDGGVIDKKQSDILPVLEDATAYLQQAILTSKTNTRLYFIDEETNKQLDMALSEIATDEKGMPVFSSTIGVKPYKNDLMEYALFSWQTTDGRSYSAHYPSFAFYTLEV